MSLSQRFLVVAVLVVAAASTALGALGGHYVQRGITEGVVTTAASSIQALVAHHLSGLQTDAALDAEDRARLDDVFAIGNDSESTRLLEIHILSLNGELIYRSLGELAGIDGEPSGFEAASRGEVASRISTFEMAAVGRIGEFPIELLEIYTPLRRAGTGEIFAVAELFYSARSVTAQRTKAQQDIWMLVSLTGLLVIAVLYFFVDRASRTIAKQRQRLAANLAESRRLSAENLALRDASEELRQSATSANEALLAQVGSDIHDGPIQLLTLIILGLSSDGGSAEDRALTTRLATEALEELRGISNGLVLPELAALTLEEAVLLAVQRHEDLNAVRVKRLISELPSEAPTVVKICAYRVVQEALTNAQRHGSATGQAVVASILGDCLVLRVSNRSGRPGGPTKGHGLGLRGMRFRVESLGGTLNTDFSGHDENVVEAEIPLGPPEAATIFAAIPAQVGQPQVLHEWREVSGQGNP